MGNNIIKICVALGFVVLLVLLTNPFMAWMPPMGLAAALLLAAVLMGVWIGFVAHEGARDEREEVHRMRSGRMAYLAGLGMLTLALVVQGLRHDIDPWISGTLAIMVVAKLVARLYADRYR